MVQHLSNIALPVLFVLWAVKVFAVTPATFQYQGVLTDASGTRLNHQVAVTFSLYTVPSGGGSLE